jgi:hypothetical protein
MLSRSGVTFTLLMIFGCQAMAVEPPPIIDVHLHYNPDQAEITDIPEALDRLRQNGVIFGIVSSKPPALALKLAEASGGWIIPFYMPYLEPERKVDWFFDDRALPAARVALASGRYMGLGEMHLIAGFTPSLKARHPIIDGMLDLAEEFDVPAVIHAEASSHLYFLPLCQRHPEARILWAHAGSPLHPDKVRKLMQACPNVWIDMAARDHMRYGKTSPIVDDDGRLLPAWHDFMLEYQDRIMIGSDPTYYEGDVTWDSPNTGWNYLGEVLEFHRRWLNVLPYKVRQKIALENAWQLFSPEAAQDLRSSTRTIVQ